MKGERASDAAYRLLLDMIVDLRLPPGAFINEQSLSAQLELGRMPVREALAQLAQDRFVTILPRRGTVVTALTLDDVLDLFEAREAVECGLAYLAATRATDEDLAILRTLVETVNRDRTVTDAEQFLKDDHAVHTFLVQMVQNPLLQDAANRIMLHSLRFWRSYWRDRPPRPEAMLPHGELLEALEQHDPDRAQQAMRRHLQASRQIVQQLF